MATKLHSRVQGRQVSGRCHGIQRSTAVQAQLQIGECQECLDRWALQSLPPFPHQVSAVAEFSSRALRCLIRCRPDTAPSRAAQCTLGAAAAHRPLSVHLLPAGTAATVSKVRPAASLSFFSSAASTFSVHMTGGSSGFTLECPATPGLVPRSWSMTGSTPR